MVGKVRASPEALLLAAYGHEDEGALGSLAGRGERLRQLDHGDRARAVVVSPVADRVRAAGGATLPGARRANVIHMGAEQDVFLLQRGVTALQASDGVGRRRALEQSLAHIQLDADGGQVTNRQ